MLRDPEVKIHRIPLQRFDQVSTEIRAQKSHPNNTSLVGCQLIDCGHFDANRLIFFFLSRLIYGAVFNQRTRVLSTKTNRRMNAWKSDAVGNLTSRSICQHSLRDARGEGAGMKEVYSRNRESRDNSNAAVAEDERENKMMCFGGKHKRKKA